MQNEPIWISKFTWLYQLHPLYILNSFWDRVARLEQSGKDFFSIEFLIIEEGCSKTKVRGRRYRSEHFLAPCSSFSPLNMFVLVLSRVEEPATAKGRRSSTETADRKNIEKILEGKATCRRDRMTYRKPGPGSV